MPAGPTPFSGRGPDAGTAPSSSSSSRTGWGPHTRGKPKQIRRLLKCVACPRQVTLAATAKERVLSVRVPAIVLCWVVGGGGESLLMQGSSCYCDALSRSGALPAALSQPVPNIHIAHTHARTRTHAHRLQRVREPSSQNCRRDKR